MGYSPWGREESDAIEWLNTALGHSVDLEAEAPILWPLDVKSQFTGKDLDARKD